MSAEPELDGFEEPDNVRKIEFDGWGRYKLPHPDRPDGPAQPWTRVTTIAGTLEDRYHLERWGKRKVLEGLVTDRGLLSQAAEIFSEYGPDPDVKEAKDRLDKLAGWAIDKAGAHKGADVGTQLHDLTERRNQGTLLSADVPPHLAANVAIYESTLQEHGITVVPEYMERIICCPELNAVGRLDNMVREAGHELLRIFDLKSQKTMDFGSMKIAIQLAIYAHGYAMFNEETWTWEEMPPVDQKVATVCHLPLLAEYEDKACHLYDVDLEWGWRWAKASFQTRKARNAKPVTPRTTPVKHTPAPTATVAKAAAKAGAVVKSGQVTLEPVNVGSAFRTLAQDELLKTGSPGLDWAAMFRQAKTLDELRRAGEECVKAGAMTDELKALGKSRRAELAG